MLICHPCARAKKALCGFTLLAFTQPGLDDAEAQLHHGAATFFFEGISRACTHQLVRHRLASFSQESQRYVALDKGEWNAVAPPAFEENEEAQAKLDEAWDYLQQLYMELRQMGIRKEDARFLLPNATETRIVTSMNYAAWSHFLWLRAVDKAAQWEIRPPRPTRAGNALQHCSRRLPGTLGRIPGKIHRVQVMAPGTVRSPPARKERADCV